MKTLESFNESNVINACLTGINSRDIYQKLEWLASALQKRVNRGLVPEVSYLAACSTMKQIVSAISKEVSVYPEFRLSLSDKKEVANRLATEIINDWIQY